ncbi:MAG TPA: ParB/RepB/Spo0J family partition protein, partial [Bryobacteraceae bacterium]|nr:ParB/RepB/Spo0J family partition protein [Bryobacteraceae bacterium]
MAKYRRRRGTVLPFLLRMKIHNQELENIPIESVQPHPENPRRGDVVAIAESIVQNGFYSAIVVQKSTRHILVGNHRWLAAKGVGASIIPAIIIDVTDEDAMRIMLADNRTAELGGYDEVALRNAIESMANTALGLSGTGYRPEEIDAILGRAPEATSGGTPMTENHDSHEHLNMLRWGKTRVHLTDEELARLDA